VVSRALVFAVMLSTAALAQQRPPLTLDEAVRIALQRNPDLQRQVLLALSAEQDLVISRSSILPRVDFNGSISRTRTAGSLFLQGVPVAGQQSVSFNNTFSANLTLRQLVFDGGKWWNNLAASDLALQAGNAQVDEQRLQISYLVEQRFYELVRAQRQLRVLADAAARSRDQADYTQRLFEGGRATQADVYAARANRDNDEVTRLGQERSVELARADLAVAVGVDPSEPLAVAEPQNLMTDPAQPPAARDAVERALQQRPSLKAFALTAEQNRKLASAAKGDYWPQVLLEAGWNRNTGTLNTFVGDPSNNSQLSGAVVLNWNLFSGLNTKATVAKAENDLQSGRRSVASDVEKAVAQLGTARQQARVAQQAELTAKEGLRLAKTRQEVGVGTQLEVRDAELKLTQAQLNVVGSLVDGREAEAALRRAQGG